MYQTKLIRLYQTLTKEELKQFKKWIQSPIHNQHPKVIQLFDFVAKKRIISPLSLKKERVFKAIYNSDTYDVYVLNHIISYAYDVLVEFIDYLEAISQENWYKINEIRAFKNRKLVNAAEKALLKLELEQSKSPLKNGDYYLHAFSLEVERFELKGTQQRSADNNLTSLFLQLSNFYSITILKYACIATTHVNVYKTSYEIPMLRTVLEEAATSGHPVIQLYYFAYQALNDPSKGESYEQLKAHFYEHNVLLSEQEGRDVLLLCINYTIKRYNTGTATFVQEAFNWYRFGLETALLLDDGQLSQYAYKNIVGIAIKVKEFEWVRAFIMKYTLVLAKEIQQNYRDFAMAKYHFAQREYDACKMLLLKVEYDDIFLNIDSKIMLLKIYYEETSFEALDALLHSFGVFLLRKAVMGYHKKNYKNLIALTKKLYRSSNWDAPKIEKIKALIDATNPLTERQWLIEQVESLL